MFKILFRLTGARCVIICSIFVFLVMFIDSVWSAALLSIPFVLGEQLQDVFKTEKVTIL